MTPIQEYKEYLQRVIRNTDMTIAQANELKICREVGKSYGVTEKELGEIR